MRILVVDNFDSFVFNLVQYLGQLGTETVVLRNDEVDPATLASSGVDGVLVSPGPGTPESAGASIPVVRACADARLPMLGVCLGHQALGVAFGATVDRAPELLHGKTSVVSHDGTGVLADLPSPFTATRYHSLAVREETLPPELVVNGRTESGVIMAMRHRDLPLHGVQFHPESVLTEGGHLLLARWLSFCGAADALTLAPALSADVETLRQAAFA
jgi:para-aminobenzoate synthetase component 2